MPTQTLKYNETTNYIAGKPDANGQQRMDVRSPLDGSLISTVLLSTANDLDKAVKAAEAAFPAWSGTPIKERAQIFFRYRELLLKNREELAVLVHTENGKTMDESYAEVDKSAELCEFACSLPQLVQGELLEVSKGVECRIERKPLGVVASIAPFNFPNMVPHWTIPNALMLGNTMILKPSEVVPISAIRIAELLKEAGLPDGVFNVVNGDRAIVEAICDHPGIKAVSFVGSTKVAKIVYVRATSTLKRAVCLGGGEEPPDRAARCAPGDDREQCGGQHERLCWPALYGRSTDGGGGCGGPHHPADDPGSEEARAGEEPRSGDQQGRLRAHHRVHRRSGEGGCQGAARRA